MNHLPFRGSSVCIESNLPAMGRRKMGLHDAESRFRFSGDTLSCAGLTSESNEARALVVLAVTGSS